MNAIEGARSVVIFLFSAERPVISRNRSPGIVLIILGTFVNNKAYKADMVGKSYDDIFK